jgi:hypothetical protein
MPYRRRRQHRPPAPASDTEIVWTFGIGVDEWRGASKEPVAELRERLMQLRARYAEIREELLTAWRKEARAMRANGIEFECPWGVAVFEARAGNWKGACRRLGIEATAAPHPHTRSPGDYDSTIPPATARAVLSGRARSPRSRRNAPSAAWSTRGLRVLAGGVMTKSTNNPDRSPEGDEAAAWRDDDEADHPNAD